MAHEKDEDEDAVDGGFVVPLCRPEGVQTHGLVIEDDDDEPPPKSGTRRTFRPWERKF